MRASRVLDSVEGYGRHDHLCLAFDDPADFAAQARDFLADGLAQGLQVHYVFGGVDEGVAAATRDWLLDELAPRRADAVKVTSIGSTYGRGHVVSAEEQIDVYARATESALADGFTGFRVAADVTALVNSPEQLDAIAHYEHLIDRYMSRHPMSALCAYDRSTLGADTVTKVGCIHPVSNVGTSFRWHAAEPVTPLTSEALALALTGEVDRSTYDVFRAALDRTDIDREQPVVLDVAGLTFVDHHALAALDDLASRHRTRIELRNAGRIVDRLAEFIEFEHLTVGGPA
ncbi:MEDS domain-containing protein [Mycolicibacterium bacteremicum]|uniref:MEDS domain-containing protein n=1 Tax=Mycolicibacterium bacteremicum TaxID=564198 RepID=UPI0026F0907E|nr:MEDS domain-containing protein [Mycolicibacterium bacteremicum]